MYFHNGIVHLDEASSGAMSNLTYCDCLPIELMFEKTFIKVLSYFKHCCSVLV